MQRSMKTRTLRTVKAALSCFMSASLVLYMPVMAYAGEYDIQYGDITITATDDSHTVDYSDNEGAKSATDPSPTVTGTSNTNTVTLDSSNGDVNVTFSNLHITSSNEAAVNATGTHDVTIELNGSNSLQSGSSHAGMEDNLNGTLTIKDDNNNGSLTATGGQGGAGIGGCRGDDGSDIEITGGTIIAQGGFAAAGIGGGGAGYDYGSGAYDYGSGSNITISGGTVTASGGESAAGIGGGIKGTGSTIKIEKSATVNVAGGADGAPLATIGAGAAIGNGGSYNEGSPVQGTPVAPDIAGLYNTGSINIYAPGTTAAQIEDGTAGQPEVTEGEVQDPNENQDPVNPGPVNPVPVNPSSNTANTIQTAENSARTDEATSTAPATEKDSDAAFNTAVDMQIDDLLRQLYSLLETGRLGEANALIAKGFVINAGTHKGFNRATLEKLGELSRAGVAVTINFTYAGVNYSVMIPAKSEIDPASLIDESGYCGFMNLM